MKRTLETVIAAVLSIGLALLFVLSLMAFRGFRSLGDESRLADRSRARLIAIQSVNRTLLTAESGQRGFLLTSELSYLDAYFTGVVATQNGLKQVALEFNDKPEEQPQVARLAALANAKLAELQQTIDLQRAHRQSEALAIVRTDSGKRMMEQIQQITGAMIAGERDQLNRKSAATQAASLLTERLFEVGEFGLALLFGGAFLFIRRSLKAQVLAEKTLAEREHLLRTITDNLPVLISYMDSDEIVRFSNSTYKKWLNLDPAETLGRPLIDVMGAKMYESRREQIQKVLAGNLTEFQSVLDLPDGPRQQQITYLPDVASDGRVVGFFALTMDVTAMKAIEHQLEQLARFDPLTGLPNRRQFEEKLSEHLLHSSRESRPYALMFLDIDHFKAINDTYGHGVGDAVLKHFGSCLQASVRRTDVVARLAGDEFVILLKGLHGRHEASMIAEKILEAIRPSLGIGDHDLNVTTSIGIAFVAQDGTTEQALFACADKALYSAKDAGRNCVRQLDCNVQSIADHRKLREANAQD
jgi:diguanylate cyclase (GGDEF)-like protein/PAS domain S-box-containing protein